MVLLVLVGGIYKLPKLNLNILLLHFVQYQTQLLSKIGDLIDRRHKLWDFPLNPLLLLLLCKCHSLLIRDVLVLAMSILVAL